MCDNGELVAMQSNTDKAGDAIYKQMYALYSSDDIKPIELDFRYREVMNQVESEKQKMLDELASDIAMHTVPEGKDLLDRHYVMNVIQSKRSKS